MNHQDAASFLLAARATGPGGLLPPALRPMVEADAYAIQRLVLEAIGPIGGWKVGASGPAAPPSCAPMPQSGLHRAPATLPSASLTTRHIESEIALLLANDLPPRARPYTAADLRAAIATCHPGIEILQSRFADPDAAGPLANLADLIRHGAYILGPSIPDWELIDFDRLVVIQTIDGIALRRTGNPAGDMLRLLVWLANEGAVWAGGLRAGQIVTTGSWTGATPALAGAHVSTMFDGAGGLDLVFSV